VAPATRASRLRAVEALGRGASPSRGAGGALHRRVLAAGLPPAVRVGLANVAARPGRAAMTLGALVVGVAAVVLALSLTASLSLVATDLLRDRTAPVRVQLQDETAAARVTAAISSDPATARYTSVAQLEVTVPQLGRIPLVAYREDAGWAGYQLISGRWFAGPDEVVAPTNVFRSGGFRLGDTLLLGAGGRSVRVTLVGEVFDEAREGTDELVLRGGWPVLTALQPDAAPTRWEVLPVTGTPAGAYRSALSDELGQAASVDIVTDSASDADFVLFKGVIGILGAVLVLASLGGVFTTVMLETRQRTRQTAILKAIGMGPRQVAVMVLASVVPVGLAAGLLGVPAGLAGQRLILGQMGEVALKTAIPASVLDVLAWPVLAGLALSGTLIGIIGALVPATRAARAAVAPVLQAE
jgi:putative ABC transport system permease protein